MFGQAPSLPPNMPPSLEYQQRPIHFSHQNNDEIINTGSLSTLIKVELNFSPSGLHVSFNLFSEPEAGFSNTSTTGNNKSFLTEEEKGVTDGFTGGRPIIYWAPIPSCMGLSTSGMEAGSSQESSHGKTDIRLFYLLLTSLALYSPCFIFSPRSSLSSQYGDSFFLQVSVFILSGLLP